MHNFSGGADGADMMFELEGEKYGVETTAFSFYGHKTISKNKLNLSKFEIDEGWKRVKLANETLKRNIYNLSPYVMKLLSRDWFQVKNSDAIYAVAHIKNYKIVDGGTGWAVQMGIDNKKIVYVYDSNFHNWFQYNYINEKFEIYEGIPKLTENFAGIGSRNIDEFGIDAIKKLYKKNINI